MKEAGREKSFQPEFPESSFAMNFGSSCDFLRSRHERNQSYEDPLFVV